MKKQYVCIAIGAIVAGLLFACAACTTQYGKKPVEIGPEIQPATPTNKIDPVVHQEPDTSGKISHFVIRKLTSTPDAPAGQKVVTDKNDIRQIVDYLAAAPKTHPTAYDNAPGTLFTITCPERQYAAALYRGNVLYYGGAYYQMDSEFTENLLKFFENIDAPRTDIQ